MAKISIYGLIDPTNKELFYIGQTCFIPKYRLINHLCSLELRHSPLYNRIKNIKKDGHKPIITVIYEFESELMERNANFIIEKKYIEEYSNLGTLLNICHNPYYDKKAKIFIEPKEKRQLVFKNGKYFIEVFYKQQYNPFKNDRFLAKNNIRQSQEEI